MMLSYCVSLSDGEGMSLLLSDMRARLDVSIRLRVTVAAAVVVHGLLPLRQRRHQLREVVQPVAAVAVGNEAAAPSQLEMKLPRA